MPANVAIVTPASLRRSFGDSLRVRYQAMGLWETGFRDFVIFSTEPDPNLPFEQERVEVGGPPRFVLRRRTGCRLNHAHQNAGLFLEGRLWADFHGLASLESRLHWKARPANLKALAHVALSLWADGRLLKRAERVICAAESIADNLARTNPHGPPRDVIRNCIRLEDFPPTACREPVVGIVGGFIGRWNRSMFTMALETARLCPGVVFRLVGELDEGQRSRAAGIPNVQILGAVDEDTFGRFFQTVSIGLLPYEDWCRGGGSRQKLLRAAASALAIVATPAGLEGFDAPPEVCVGRTPLELADHIRMTLADPEERERRGRAARERIAQYHDFRREGQRLAELYDRFLTV